MIQIKDYAEKHGVSHQRVVGKIRRTGIAVQTFRERGKVFIVENAVFRDFDKSFKTDMVEQKKLVTDD